MEVCRFIDIYIYFFFFLYFFLNFFFFILKFCPLSSTDLVSVTGASGVWWMGCGDLPVMTNLTVWTNFHPD